MCVLTPCVICKARRRRLSFPTGRHTPNSSVCCALYRVSRMEREEDIIILLWRYRVPFSVRRYRWILSEYIRTNNNRDNRSLDRVNFYIYFPPPPPRSRRLLKNDAFYFRINGGGGRFAVMTPNRFAAVGEISSIDIVVCRKKNKNSKNTFALQTKRSVYDT